MPSYGGGAPAGAAEMRDLPLGRRFVLQCVSHITLYTTVLCGGVCCALCGQSVNPRREHARSFALDSLQFSPPYVVMLFLVKK